MKIQIILIPLLLGASIATADTTTTSGSQSTTRVDANASSTSSGNQSGNQGQHQGVNQDFSNHSITNAPAVDLSKSVGMAISPSLTTTFSETCMGSTSAGAGFAGGALSIGSTWQDESCIRRLNAREIRTYGFTTASKEIMCGDKEVRAAFKRVNLPCAADGGLYNTSAELILTDPQVSSSDRQAALYAAAVLRLKHENKNLPD